MREVCHLVGDEDGDGLSDCADPDCVGVAACREDLWGWCEDGLDNDGDGLVDCDDPECLGLPPCAERCADRGDEDRDGLVDCADDDCEGDPACLEDCTDGVDNDDADLLADCADPECVGHEACRERCSGGIDDDLDGLTDCDDVEDCSRDLGCLAARPLRRDAPCPPTRPEFVLTDGFDQAIAPAQWHSFSTGEDDAPAWQDGSVDLGGRDGRSTSGLASAGRFGLGADQPLTATLRFKPAGVCGGPEERRCEAKVELHTRDVWDDADQVGGVSILAVEVRLTSRWDAALMAVRDSVLTVACEYHGQPVGAPATITYPHGALADLELSADGPTVAVKLLGTDVCALGPLRELEPEARLVIHSGQAAGDPPPGAPTSA